MYLRVLRLCVPRSQPTRFCSYNNDFAGHELVNSIAELNKEMESVFGEAPPVGRAGSVTASDHFVDGQKKLHHRPNLSPKGGESATTLTHTSPTTGEAQMVDVSSKESTKRTARASCKVMLGEKAFHLVLANKIVKGDVLTLAKIAGISGAKQTSSLIPLCHNISLSHVSVDLRLNREDYSVIVEGVAVSTGKTGVEMEAMTAVSISGLTVYDMCKAASKEIEVTEIRLEHKSGGKSGDWSRGK